MLSYTVINGYFCKVTLQWHYIKANLCENCAKIVRKLCENCAKIVRKYYSRCSITVINSFTTMK